MDEIENTGDALEGAAVLPLAPAAAPSAGLSLPYISRRGRPMMASWSDLHGQEPTRGLTPIFGEIEEPKQGPAPTLEETWDASMVLHNAPRAALELAARPDFEPDRDPTAWLNSGWFKGSRYEAIYSSHFQGVRSEREALSIKARIDGEEHAQEIRNRSGFVGILTDIAAGTLDPINLIPIGGGLRMGTKTGRIAVAAATTSAGAAATVAAQEAILHAAQETRTTAESVFAIGAASLLGGVLGAGIGALARADLDQLARAIKLIPSTREEEAAAYRQMLGLPGSAGAAATDAARGSGELKGALGGERVFGWQDPLIRLHTSEFASARNTVRDLAEAPLTLAENADGVATTIGGSVETRIKMANAPLARALLDMDDAFQRYYFGKPTVAGPLRAELARLTGRGGGKMTYREFKEAVFDALLAGDVHAVPEVAEAAQALRARVLNPLRDEAMEFVPGFRQQVEDMAEAGVDAGYVPRVYNTEAIRAGRSRFVSVLTSHFMARQADLERKIADLELKGEKIDDAMRLSAGMSEAEVRSLAEEVTDTILGHNPGRMMLPSDIVAGPRGALKERTLNIPTSLIRDFVERDPEVLGLIYTRTMATDTNLVRRFGSADMREQIAKVNDEANARIAAATTEKERARIDKQRRADIRDIEGIRDRLRGTYALPTNPEGLANRAGKVVRNLNYLRLLGGMTLSAIPDIAKPMFQHGLTRTLGTMFHPFVRGLRTAKLAGNEVKLAGTALDMVLDSRVMAIADIMDDFGRGSKFERGLHAATRRFGVVSLMAPWNATIKQFTGIISQTRMLQSIERVVAGKASRKEIEYLAANGIDAPMADRIWAQFHGGEQPVSTTKPATAPAGITKNGKTFRDTREEGVQYHGSRQGEVKADSGHYTSKDYYGQGFYTTNAMDVAFGYSKGSGGIYRVEPVRPLNIYDAEQPMTAEMRAALTPPTDSSTLDALILDALEGNEITRAAPVKSVRALYDRLRQEGTAEGLSADSIQDAFETINEVLRRQGFDGLSHRGGDLTGAPAHKVEIYFDPENDIRMTKVDADDFAAPAAAAETSTKTEARAGHGVRDGAVWWANTEAWTDRQAVEAFRAALVRDVDRAIVTPGQDKPLWFSTGVGKIIAQFKTFGVASIQRTLLSGLQQRDMAALNGTLLMLALGAVSYAVKSAARGQPTSDDPKKWAVEALDQSGLLGWLMDANNGMEKFTRGRIGLSAITGEYASRYQSRNSMGALLGPTFDVVTDAMQMTGSAFSGDWKAGDTHALRKVLPLQNLFYIRQLLDRAEAGVNGAFGIPMQKRN